MNWFLMIFYVILMMEKTVSLPLIINTWPWPQATDEGWNTLNKTDCSISAVVDGCSRCEEDQCDGTVGFGGSPDEDGETTLDALIMNGTTMNVGSVGCLRRVKNAIKVARFVLEKTDHTMLVGELATKFALQMGFKEESLSTDQSIEEWKNWKERNCQPNYRRNVAPDPASSCGPYHPMCSKYEVVDKLKFQAKLDQTNHDTIGMVAINSKGQIAAGTSTNGMNHKIPGRVGDSPVAGAGAYADDDVGAAVATGDGDVMMRFLPTFTIVELMRSGYSPQNASKVAMQRIVKRHPDFQGAVVAVSKHGEIGASCVGFSSFSFCVRDVNDTKTRVVPLHCI